MSYVLHYANVSLTPKYRNQWVFDHVQTTLKSLESGCFFPSFVTLFHINKLNV